MDSPPTWLPLAIIGGFLVVFPLFWCAVVWLLGRVGGWHRLAQTHAAGARAVSGTRVAGVQGKVGVVSYRRILTLHFADEGLFVDVMVLFRPGQPRLFIPWTAIGERKRGRMLFWRFEKLSIGRPPIATLTLPADLLDAHGPRLPPADS